jgi:hypothetical protein
MDIGPEARRGMRFFAHVAARCLARGLARGLACVALCVGALAAAPAAQASALTFRAVEARDPILCAPRCPVFIVAEGEIVDASADAFNAFLAARRSELRGARVVLLHSPGGRVGASLRLGEAFRTAGASVVVARTNGVGVLPGRCYSACVYAFIGGAKRIVPKGSEIAVHRMFMYERLGADPEGPSASRVFAHPELVARLAEYARRMGVSAELVHRAEQVAPERVHVVNAQEMRRWRLARREM